MKRDDHNISINSANAKSVRSISDLYEDWFLDYASYVILERAIPNIEDGLKPVQRRILYSMHNIHDGRYHKVANIIGHTMQYHPHGDQAIGDALVGLGQKNLLIDTQGNWGDVRTGDKAAAPRYIEARLTNFAQTIVFNKNITNYQNSYDGRKKEPILLPVKFPLVLAQGVEGIAVGLSTKILPHNFIELTKSSIAILENKSFKLFPDFESGGMIDVKNYLNGKKGGRIRIRCNIDVIDKETLKISNLPYSVTTSSLIESIIKANNNGKIKIKKIEDNTSEHIEIIIFLVKGVSTNVTIDALYAFTSCEISLSPNCCVIVNNKPQFLSVPDLLKISTNNTVSYLKEELKFNLKSVEEKWHIATLIKIFIENKIYIKIENCETWASVLSTISNELIPYRDQLERNISKDDILSLTEMQIKKISKYDTSRQKDKINLFEKEIKKINKNIENIIEYSINFFNDLIEKYGKGKNRKTQITEFDSISQRRVVVANKKLYVNRSEGFIGTGIKNDEFISKCSDIDNVIVFCQDGSFLVTQIGDKKFIKKNILHVSVWKKNDEHMVYNTVYKDGLSKISYVKRFSVTSIIRDKIYNLTQGNVDSKVIYFTSNPNSESEIVNIFLHGKSKAKKKYLEYDFSSLAIKGRLSKGNILTKYSIRKINQKMLGESTLGGRNIWIDESIGRLNTEKRGMYLGRFNSDDKIIVIYFDGSYEMTSFNLSNRYKMSNISIIERFSSDIVYSILYQEGKSKNYYIKRFKILTKMINRRFLLIPQNRGSKCIVISNYDSLFVEYNYRLNNGDKKNKKILLDTFIDVKGWKTIGKKIDNKKRMSGFRFINNKFDDENHTDNSNHVDLDNNELTLF